MDGEVIHFVDLLWLVVASFIGFLRVQVFLTTEYALGVTGVEHTSKGVSYFFRESSPRQLLASFSDFTLSLGRECLTAFMVCLVRRIKRSFYGEKHIEWPGR